MAHDDTLNTSDTDAADATVNASAATAATAVYTPYRRVVATTDDGTDVPFDGVDVDIDVTHHGSGVPKWSVTAYGLDHRLWESLNHGDDIAITVGWRDGPNRVAARGPIQVMRPQPWGGTTKYTFRGTTHAGARLGKRVSRTWKDVAPHRIARDIAAIANLSVGHINTDADVFEGHWTMTTSRTLAQWLTELTAEATRHTDREWTWYVRGTALHFVPRGTPTGETLALSHKTGTRTYPSRNGSHSPPERAAHERQFNQRLEPFVDRGRAVAVTPPGTDANDPATHVVGGFQFETSSRTGRHYCHGTLVPQQTAYSARDPRRSSAAADVAPEEPDGG